jgi:hypothetical protein
VTRFIERLRAAAIRTAIRAALGTIGFAATAASLHAQWNVARFDMNRHRIHATAGVDPAVITAVGYSYTRPVMGRPVQVGIEGGVVAASMDANDFRARLQAGLSVVQWKSLHVNASGAFVTRGTKNNLYKAITMGADVGTTVGMYTPRWFVAGETGYDKSVVTRLTHSDWYRTHFYPDAKSGWYVDTGGTWRFGGIAGVALGKTELVVRAGVPRTRRGNSIGVPYYASLGLGHAF